MKRNVPLIIIITVAILGFLSIIMKHFFNFYIPGFESIILAISFIAVSWVNYKRGKNNTDKELKIIALFFVAFAAYELLNGINEIIQAMT